MPSQLLRQRTARPKGKIGKVSVSDLGAGGAGGAVRSDKGFGGSSGFGSSGPMLGKGSKSKSRGELRQRKGFGSERVR